MGSSAALFGAFQDTILSPEARICRNVLLRMAAEGGEGVEWDADVADALTDPDRTDDDRELNREFLPRNSHDAHLEATSDDRGPVSTRLMLALSDDGETWIKTGMVIANHGSVPCLAVEENADGVETLYLFYITPRSNLERIYNDDDYHDMATEGRDPRNTPLVVAYTTDLTTWTYRFLDHADAGFNYRERDEYGPEEDYSANDPSVVRAHSFPMQIGELEVEGFYQWLMYYTLHYGPEGEDTEAVILVAGARNLYEFIWVTLNSGQQVLPPPDADPGSKAEDPSALPMGYNVDLPSGYESEDRYLLFAGGNRPNFNWKASIGGFGEEVLDWEEIVESCGGLVTTVTTGGAFGDRFTRELVDPIIMNNAVDAPGTSLHGTWFAAAGPDLDKYIVSIPINARGAIEGGTYRTGGCNVAIVQDQIYEYNGISEAAVARFGGCWVMVYVTGIEPSSTMPA